MGDVQAQTVTPPSSGRIRGNWQERFGAQSVVVKVDPSRRDPDRHLSVNLERRWGPQLGDVRTQDFWISREGAETLRDALTAALEWSPDAEGGA